MEIDLKQVLDTVLPMVQDGRQQEAQRLIERNVSDQSPGGLLGAIGSLLGGGPGAVGGPAGGLNLGGLAKAAPVLLSMIKPEHIESITAYIGDLVAGKIGGISTKKKKSASTAKKPAAKKSTAAGKKTTSTAAGKSTGATAKKTTAAGKKTAATAKKPAAKKSTAATKKTTAKK